MQPVTIHPSTIFTSCTSDIFTQVIQSKHGIIIFSRPKQTPHIADFISLEYQLLREHSTLSRRRNEHKPLTEREAHD